MWAVVHRPPCLISWYPFYIARWTVPQTSDFRQLAVGPREDIYQAIYTIPLAVAQQWEGRNAPGIKFFSPLSLAWTTLVFLLWGGQHLIFFFWRVGCIFMLGRRGAAHSGSAKGSKSSSYATDISQAHTSVAWGSTMSQSDTAGGPRSLVCGHRRWHLTWSETMSTSPYPTAPPLTLAIK